MAEKPGAKPKTAAEPKPRLRDLQGRFARLEEQVRGRPAAAQVQAAEPAAARPRDPALPKPGLRELRAAAAKAKSRSAPTSRAASRSSSISASGAEREPSREGPRIIPQDQQSFKTAEDRDSHRGQGDRGSEADESHHDISEGDAGTEDADWAAYEEDADWAAGLQPLGAKDQEDAVPGPRDVEYEQPAATAPAAEDDAHGRYGDPSLAPASEYSKQSKEEIPLAKQDPLKQEPSISTQ